MKLNYAKNIRIKDILLGVATSIIYFCVAGFAGKLITLFACPFLSIFVKNNADLESTILYFISVAVMFGILSFFSFKDACNDAELLKFSYLKTIISCFSAALIFCLVCSFVNINYSPSDDNILQYIIYPYFPPYAIIDFLLSAPLIGNVFQTAQNYIYMGENILCLVLIMLFDIAFIMLAYKLAWHIWVTGFKKKGKKIDVSEKVADEAGSDSLDPLASFFSANKKDKIYKKDIRGNAIAVLKPKKNKYPRRNRSNIYFQSIKFALPKRSKIQDIRLGKNKQIKLNKKSKTKIKSGKLNKLI